MDKRTVIFVLALVGALFCVNLWFDSGKEVRAPTPVEAVAAPAPPAQSNEQYHVLENAYQQLVFSNVGGALAEINLSLKGEGHEGSFVRPIEFDKQMVEQVPDNAYFPGHSVGNGKRVLGGYYPLLRRNLIDASGKTIARISPSNYAFAIVDSEGKTATYQMKKLEKDSIEFEANHNGVRITKIFHLLQEPPYSLTLTLKVDGNPEGMWISSGIPEVELISGSAAPSLKYQIVKGKKAVVEQLSLPKAAEKVESAHPVWTSNGNGFLGLIMSPLQEIPAGVRAQMVPGTDAPTRLSVIDAQYDLYPASKYPGYLIQLPIREQTTEFMLFTGPYSDSLLKEVDLAHTDPTTGTDPNFAGALSFHGWFTFISEPFAKFLFFLMKLFYKVTSSWGFSIILLTIALRLMLYPLNAWSIRSTLRMQEISPRVAMIQEKHKKDPKRAQMEIMNLYREKGINPLSGCFPLLIQLPFLIGMFDLLKSVFELRGAPFIPGWIENLTAPDRLFSWNYPVPFFGTDFHLLPLILGAVMYFQQKMSASTPKAGEPMTDQQKQQKMMGNIMTIVFTVMFYHFPSGLNLYWLSSMALGILQQWWMTRFKKSNLVQVK